MQRLSAQDAAAIVLARVGGLDGLLLGAEGLLRRGAAFDDGENLPPVLVTRQAVQMLGCLAQ